MYAPDNLEKSSLSLFSHCFPRFTAMLVYPALRDNILNTTTNKHNSLTISEIKSNILLRTSLKSSSKIVQIKNSSINILNITRSICIIDVI